MDVFPRISQFYALWDSICEKPGRIGRFRRPEHIYVAWEEFNKK